MFELLNDMASRPEPFSRYTAKELWTSPHLARQMLSFHINQETDLASRRFDQIDQVVHWIDTQLHLSGKRLCDLGCGPGLYTQRFEAKGAEVTGVDFSEHSLAYAKQQNHENHGSVNYVLADYLSDELPTGFDVITLIYTDFSVLSPEQRRTLLSRMHTMLNRGGQIVIDVAGAGAFKGKIESTVLEPQLMGGFWAEGDYVGLQRSFIYPDISVSLDRYLIVEPNKSWEIYNWFQYFTADSIESILREAGFSVIQMVGDLTGRPLDTDSGLIGIIADKV